MEDVTLVIPAKNEPESLPKVLDEIKKYNLKIIVVIPKEDVLTKEAIKNYNCTILPQFENGFGNALILGINAV